MRDKGTCSTATGERQHEGTGGQRGDISTEQDAIGTLIAERAVAWRAGQEQIEAAIVGLLLIGGHAGPWTRAEIEREIGGNLLDVCDALVALHASGLIHLEGELVIASRAARRMDELDV